MKEKFPGYYRPTDEEFEELWDNCIFAFDANVLLHLFRYSPESADQLWEVLKKLDERVWIPHQVALEYHKNLPSVRNNRDRAGERFLKQVEQLNMLDKIEQKRSEYSGHNHMLTKDALIQPIEDALSEVKEAVEQIDGEIPDGYDDKERKEDIADFFSDKVGEGYPEDDLKEKYKEGKKRYRENIPPGFEDENKNTKREKYGDYVLWCQLKDKADKDDTPLIFVTDDKKKDWWLEAGGKTIGPRPELIQEMKKEADTDFYMYKVDQFLSYAKEHLQADVKNKTINEAKEASRQEKASATRAANISASVKDYLESIEQKPDIDSVVQQLVSQGKIGRKLSGLYSSALNPNLANLIIQAQQAKSEQWKRLLSAALSSNVEPEEENIEDGSENDEEDDVVSEDD